MEIMIESVSKNAELGKNVSIVIEGIGLGDLEFPLDIEEGKTYYHEHIGSLKITKLEVETTLTKRFSAIGNKSKSISSAPNVRLVAKLVEPDKVQMTRISTLDTDDLVEITPLQKAVLRVTEGNGPFSGEKTLIDERGE